MPTFFTSVEVGGQVFRGGAGKSKKQAEMNAAKVAFAFLEECKSLVPFVIVCIYALVFDVCHNESSSVTDSFCMKRK